ncbi:UNVERIFIED_CONTAM: hypothetical protein FKN15_023771 [Acipenser sinensis]
MEDEPQRETIAGRNLGVGSQSLGEEARTDETGSPLPEAPPAAEENSADSLPNDLCNPAGDTEESDSFSLIEPPPLDWSESGSLDSSIDSVGCSAPEADRDGMSFKAEMDLLPDQFNQLDPLPDLGLDVSGAVASDLHRVGLQQSDDEQEDRLAGCEEEDTSGDYKLEDEDHSQIQALLARLQTYSQPPATRTLSHFPSMGERVASAVEDLVSSVALSGRHEVGDHDPQRDRNTGLFFSEANQRDLLNLLDDGGLGEEREQREERAPPRAQYQAQGSEVDSVGSEVDSVVSITYDEADGGFGEKQGKNSLGRGRPAGAEVSMYPCSPEEQPEPVWMKTANFSMPEEEQQQQQTQTEEASSKNCPAYKEVPGPCDPEDLLDGVIFGAKYLGSTRLLSVKNPSTSTRMAQAQEAVDRIKAPEGESQPMTEVDLFISTKRIKVLSADTQSSKNCPAYKEVPGPCDPEDLLDGVIFGAKYLGSTRLLSVKNPSTSTRMAQAQEAVDRIKAPEGESQPMTEVDLFISTKRIKVLSADTQEAMMDHSLQSISYIADIGSILVLMARRKLPGRSAAEGEGEGEGEASCSPAQKKCCMICHAFHSEDAQLIAQAIGQAFSVAYQQFLQVNGIKPSELQPSEYSDYLGTQELYNGDLVHFSRSENIRQVRIEKPRGEILGLAIVESGWGSILPTVVVANLLHGGAAERCGELSIGDRVMSVNGTSLVGLPITTCQSIIRDLKNQTEVKLSIVHCPPVTMAIIKRPDPKYQLGFSVEDGILENLTNFIKAITAYGLKPHDIFEANDLFESGNLTQVQTTLLALAGMAKTKGIQSRVDIGVKYADKQKHAFDEEKVKAGKCVIGLQMGTNKCASQAGMNAYGTRRHLYDPKAHIEPPMDSSTIGLQMGTNKGASQTGMTAPGTRRAIYDQKLGTEKCDNSTMSLQMGYTQGANQSGQNFGLGRQIYDAKYCPKSELGEDEAAAGISYNQEYQDEGYQGYQEDGQD